MIDRVARPGAEDFSIAEKFGELLAGELCRDPHFYFFSPDETTSNRLQAVFGASERAWNLPAQSWDLPESAKGRIIELLSENVLFATLCGHLENGEAGVMASYESFFNIIFSQIAQEIKFLAQAEAVPWRPDRPAVNLLSTSVCWRQDHNGFTHQSPALISALLNLPSRKVNCLFPVDDVSAEATWEFMRGSRNVVNLTTFDKNKSPRWLDSHHARFQFAEGGASVFGFATDGFGENWAEQEPDVIFATAGDIATREALLAVRILKTDRPELRIRFVGVNALSYGRIGTADNPLSQEKFDYYFGDSDAQIPIIANFHGYARTFADILAGYTGRKRLHTHGFADRGATTTPFEMLALNGASRYDLAIDVATHLGRPDLAAKYRQALAENHCHAVDRGEDLPEIAGMWF